MANELSKIISGRPIRNGASVSSYSVAGTGYSSYLSPTIAEPTDVDGNLVNIWSGQISDEPFSVGRGGTGGNTAADAMTNLLPSQTEASGKVLSTNGSTLLWINN